MDDASQDTRQLDHQLNTLLEQIETTTTNLVERISDDSPGLTYADLATTQEEPEPTEIEPAEIEPAQIEPADIEPTDIGTAEADSAETDSAEVEQEVRAMPQDQQLMPETDLESAVEHMLQQVIEESETAADKADALDAELARLGDDLLAAETVPEADVPEPARDHVPDLDEPDNEPAGPAPPPADALPVSVPPADIQPVDVATPDDIEPIKIAAGPAPAQPAAAQPASAQQTEVPTPPTPAAAPGAQTPSRRWLATVWAHVHTIAAGAKARAPILWRSVRPRLVQALTLMSRPLDGKPPIVRSAVGWAAIVTAFWAVVVIIYVVAIRDPAPPTPQQADVEMGPFESMFLPGGESD